MSRKVANPAQSISKLAKKQLPKELVDTMRTLPDLYWFKSKTMFRTRKQFNELFYSPRTSNATRTFMLWGGLHRDPHKPDEMVSHTTEAQKKYGKKSGYKIDYVTDRSGRPVGLKVVAYSTKSKRLEDVKFTTPINRALKYAQFDRISGNMVNQIVNKNIDIARGLKAGVIIAQVQKFIMAVIWQVEATVFIQGSLAKGQYIPRTPDDDEVNYDELEEDEGDEFKVIDLGGFAEHTQHYLSEFDNKISKFLYLLNAEVEGEDFYQEYANWAAETIPKDNYVGDADEVQEVAQEICDGAIPVLKSIHIFADKVAKCRFHTKEGRKRLNKLRKSIKVPIVNIHQSAGTNLPEQAAMIQERYTESMQRSLENIKKWEIPK